MKIINSYLKVYTNLMNSQFTIYPAIDLRNGQVVRLQQGDSNRQKIYADDPAEVAERWLSAGARWLHVVNLDGAFGEPDSANESALSGILGAAANYGAKVQLGGGLRSIEAVRQSIQMGVSRVVLGTLALEKPQVLAECIREFGPNRIAAGIDARDGLVTVRGWREETTVKAITLGIRLAETGLKWVIFTDVSRDGLGKGLNVPATAELKRASRLSVIASGGVNETGDIEHARQAGLSGVIIGSALYEGKLEIKDWVLEGK
jgi:phosphoribosylformimino-5-aminoimidazole carboxamide ribotide isomerase